MGGVTTGLKLPVKDIGVTPWSVRRPDLLQAVTTVMEKAGVTILSKTVESLLPRPKTMAIKSIGAVVLSIESENWREKYSSAQRKATTTKVIVRKTILA